MSVRENIIAAATAAVAGLVTVHRNRAIPLDTDQLPSVVVYPVQETSERHPHHPVTMHQLVLRCEVRAYGDPADQAMDYIVSHVVKKLLTDPTLNALVKTIEEQSKQWDVAVADRVIGGCACDFVVTYPTFATDPDTQLTN